ncbi:MAG TPA: L,D-transpeptidase family protein, partial [Methyloceanibacter sp.]
MRSLYAEERRLVLVLLVVLLTTFSQIADARTKQSRWDAVADGRAPGELVLGVVALAEQRITLYDAKGPVLRASISSGRNNYETPAGVFGVLQKEAEHYSNRYDDAAMPFMQRITWSGIALHAGPLPGYPASHGCIRLPYKFAEQIFGMTKLGFRVVIARKDVAPTILSHPLLSRLVPSFPDAAAPQAAAHPATRLQDIATEKREASEAAAKKADEATAVARAQAAAGKRVAKLLLAAEDAKGRAERQLEAAGRDFAQAKSPARIRMAQSRMSEAAQELSDATARLEATRLQAQPKIDAAEEARKAAEAAEAAKSAAQEQARAARRKLWPVSIFISLKTRRLYVRQGFEPVMEFPVAISEPDKPVGTMILTAADNGEGKVGWNAVAIDGTRVATKRDRNNESVSTSLGTAVAALDRITLPQEVADLVSESVWVGTSLILSDEGPHKETGQATDFIVVMSGEPQG